MYGQFNHSPNIIGRIMIDLNFFIAETMILLENAIFQSHFNKRILDGMFEIVAVLVIIWFLLVILFLNLFYALWNL